MRFRTGSLMEDAERTINRDLIPFLPLRNLRQITVMQKERTLPQFSDRAY